MKVVFRADASLQIGTGHVMRCLTLADKLRAAGAHCCFICRNHPGNLITQIRQRGFTVCVLHDPSEKVAAKEFDVDVRLTYESWLGVDWATDAAQTSISLGETEVDWIIVDHYALDSRWEKAIRPRCRKLMVIDDLADRMHDCNLLLDQNLGRSKSDYSQIVPSNCTILAGPYYALLRPEFSALRETSLCRRSDPELKHLLITMGGVDQCDATSTVLEALHACQLPAELQITVVLGEHAPWLAHVQVLAKQLLQPIEIKKNVRNMASLMAESDLVIGAAGSTLWECCCLGVPALIMVLAENQRRSANSLKESGSIILLENVDVNPLALGSIIDDLISTDALSQLSIRNSLITDGEGASRVLDALGEIHG